MDVWNRLMEMVNLDEAKKEFIENRPENPHINYFRNPISGIRELERLMKSLEPKLPAINVPALVVQSAGDPVVNPAGTKRVFDMLGSERKKYVLFDFDCHGILVCEGSERVHRTIGNFIKHL
jgi:esterase/lipase